MGYQVTAYKSGKRLDIPDDPVAAVEAVTGLRGGFVWVDLVSPEATEFEKVTAQLGLGDMPYEEYTQHRPRHVVEKVGDLLFMALKCFERTEVDGRSKLSTNQVFLCVSKESVLTVHGNCHDLVTAVRRRVEARPKFLANGPYAVLQAIADEVVAGYDRVAHDIEADIIELEHDVFDVHTSHPVDEIYALKREVLFFRRVEDPLHSVLSDLARDEFEAPKGTLAAFQQTLDRLDRVDHTIDSLNELITSILQAHLAEVAVRQNADMRKISSWAAIIAVPTMVAGIYGMNFDYMPELKWWFGYPLAVSVMLGGAFTVYRLAKKSGWL